MIGQYDSAVALAVEDLHIPFLCTTPVPRSDLHFTVQMIPTVDDISQAILEYAQLHNWKKISVFYDNDMGKDFLFCFKQCAGCHYQVEFLNSNNEI